MPGIQINEDEIDRRARVMFDVPPEGQPSARQKRDARTAIAQEQHPTAAPPAGQPAPAPDYYVVTTEVTHGDRVVSVTQQHIPIPKENTA